MQHLLRLRLEQVEHLLQMTATVFQLKLMILVIAVAPGFRANNQIGSYNVTGSILGLPSTLNFSLQNGYWYVSPTGNDNNVDDCRNSLLPCATINHAIQHAVTEGTILLSTGTYNDTGDSVVTVSKSVTLSGGWNSTFTAQDGQSVIDGENLRRSVVVSSGVTASMDHFDLKRRKDCLWRWRWYFK